MLQFDLNKAVGSWVNFILFLTYYFPLSHTPNFYSAMMIVSPPFFLKKNPCTAELLFLRNHPCAVAKELSHDLISADPLVPGPNLNCTGW